MFPLAVICVLLITNAEPPAVINDILSSSKFIPVSKSPKCTIALPSNKLLANKLPLELMSPLVCKPLEVIPPLALISPVELILILSVSVPLSVVKNCRFESFDDGNAR